MPVFIGFELCPVFSYFVRFLCLRRAHNRSSGLFDDWRDDVLAVRFGFGFELFEESVRAASLFQIDVERDFVFRFDVRRHISRRNDSGRRHLSGDIARRAAGVSDSGVSDSCLTDDLPHHFPEPETTATFFVRNGRVKNEIVLLFGGFRINCCREFRFERDEFDFRVFQILAQSILNRRQIRRAQILFGTLPFAFDVSRVFHRLPAHRPADFDFDIGENAGGCKCRMVISHSTVKAQIEFEKYQRRENLFWRNETLLIRIYFKNKFSRFRVGLLPDVSSTLTANVGQQPDSEPVVRYF